MPLTVTREVYRRFLMGMQGLWPGRRFQGRDGVRQALRQAEAIQIDPMSVIHRSHDLALWGRVLNYTPEMLDGVMYEDRAFFDWGDVVMIFPMDELPYWRGGPMQTVTKSLRARFAVLDDTGVIEEVRAELRAQSPRGGRDFAGGDKTGRNTFRPKKLTGLALTKLWLDGEIMTHSRRTFERLYAFSEDVAPREHQWVADPQEAERFFARKILRMLGMPTAKELRGMMGPLERKLTDRSGRYLQAALDASEVTEVRVEHSKQPGYVMTSSMPLLEDLIAGGIPEAWQPIGPTTLDEVTFLSPLEMVSARGRAATVFDFEYIWEAYKPAEKRRWGYYVLPILYGDDLVARMDSKLDRKTTTLHVLGLWLEPHQRAGDPDFGAALGRGLARFVQFHEATSVDLSGIMDAGLRETVAGMVEQRTQ